MANFSIDSILSPEFGCKKDTKPETTQIKVKQEFSAFEDPLDTSYSSSGYTRSPSPAYNRPTSTSPGMERGSPMSSPEPSSPQQNMYPFSPAALGPQCFCLHCSAAAVCPQLCPSACASTDPTASPAHPSVAASCAN